MENHGDATLHCACPQALRGYAELRSSEFEAPEKQSRLIRKSSRGAFSHLPSVWHINISYKGISRRIEHTPGYGLYYFSISLEYVRDFAAYSACERSLHALLMEKCGTSTRRKIVLTLLRHINYSTNSRVHLNNPRIPSSSSRFSRHAAMSFEATPASSNLGVVTKSCLTSTTSAMILCQHKLQAGVWVAKLAPSKRNIPNARGTFTRKCYALACSCCPDLTSQVEPDEHIRPRPIPSAI